MTTTQRQSQLDLNLTFSECLARLPVAAAASPFYTHWNINTYRNGCKLQLGWTTEKHAVEAAKNSLALNKSTVAVAVVDRAGKIVYADGRAA